MEYLFDMACKLPSETNITKTSEAFKLNKKLLQDRFWEELTIRVSQVKHGKGSSNDGNTARHFFKKNQSVTSDILGIDEKIIILFTELLDMFNDPIRKPCSKTFAEKARELFVLLTSPALKRFPITQSVHRFLCHGADFIDHFELPVGALSESALEVLLGQNVFVTICRRFFKNTIQ
jgi:hypothetical protein